MAYKKGKNVNRPKPIPRGNCPWCKLKKEPSYKEFENLKKYLSDRARIANRSRTGVCSRHQRLMSREIKRARHLGLLPFAPTVR